MCSIPSLETLKASKWVYLIIPSQHNYSNKAYKQSASILLKGSNTWFESHKQMPHDVALSMPASFQLTWAWQNKNQRSMAQTNINM